MPPRKKAKLVAEQQTPQDSMAGIPESTLHPDLQGQAASLKMDPSLLHPDLQAATNTLSSAALQQQPSEFTVNPPVTSAPAPPKQRKNAAAASRAAAAMAAQLQQQLQQHEQQQQNSQPTALQEQEESTVSVDAAAEFLRTIQERESQKNILALTTQQDPVIAGDNSLPTDLAALQYPIHQPQASYAGFPTAAQFNAMVDEYLSSLSVKKQAKALLTQQMYDDILAVLLNPNETKTGSAQFRFWAKKMFRLVTTQVAHIVIHDNKPVAVKEQLYDVLVQCHGQANHGGRDKTAAQVSLRIYFDLYLGQEVLFVGSERTHCEVRQGVSQLCTYCKFCSSYVHFRNCYCCNVIGI